MEAPAATAPPADAALGARTRIGDRDAFTALYAPHLAGVYDYVLRIVRDRAVAADVVRATFARARGGLPEQGNDVCASLFASAHERALDALRFRRHRNGSEREALDFTQVDADRLPNASVVFDKELVELVWDAAAALPPEDYSVLVLHVRHELAPGLLGDQLGSNGAVSRRLVRARDALDENVTSELVVRRARHNCPELEILLRNNGDSGAAQHIRRCARCHESRARFMSPAGVLRGLKAIPPPPALERELFGASQRRRRRFGILWRESGG
jgi:DNA-directed RNA polymerase specialized sigma24 family protein